MRTIENVSEITTKLRKTAREAYIKGLLGVEPVWRYTVNLPATLEYRRHGKALQDEAARVVADLNKYGCATTTVEALTGDPEMFGKLQTLAQNSNQRRLKSSPIKKPSSLNPETSATAKTKSTLSSRCSTMTARLLSPMVFSPASCSTRK